MYNEKDNLGNGFSLIKGINYPSNYNEVIYLFPQSGQCASNIISSNNNLKIVII